MHLQKEWVVAITVVVLSQWAGQVWLAGYWAPQQMADSSKGIGKTLTDMRYQLQRIEALQAAKMVSVNPATNTVTMDQSMLQDTLREIVANELDRISPALSAEYSNTKPGIAYVGETNYMTPEQAYTQSAAIIQDALQAGEWDGSHSAEMAPLMNNLTHEQRIQLLEQYTEAVSRGEIKITGTAPPL